MVKVHLWSGLRKLAEGSEVIEVEASTVGQMLDAIGKAHPGLADYLEEGVSVSVDGRILAGDLTAPVTPENEIWLMQRLKGG